MDESSAKRARVTSELEDVLFLFASTPDDKFEQAPYSFLYHPTHPSHPQGLAPRTYPAPPCIR